MTRPHTLALVAFEGISPFHLSVPCLIFGESRPALGLPPYDVRICTKTPGMLTTSVGMQVVVPHGLAALDEADTVIIPSWPGHLPEPPVALLAALQAAHQRGARLVGLCLGAFVLARAGLLDGRRATTHWAWLEALRQGYPRVTVAPGELYVADGTLVTSAGTVAAIDCCLDLLRRQAGAEATKRLARYLVTPPYRQGNQAQYIEQPVIQTRSDTRLQGAMDWALAHLTDTLEVDQLAARALMSRRTFTRHFRQQTGTSPHQWLLHQRLMLAQRLLETTPLGLDQVAEQSGLGSALSLRLHFARVFDTTPAAYRREFTRQQAEAG